MSLPGNEARTYRVLLIDDDEQLRRLYLRFFRMPEYDTRLAANGADAIEQLREWKPDVVLLDLMMPHRGTEVIQVLRIHPSAVGALFIAFSGTLLEEDRESMRAAGFDEVIPKGQEATVVVERVRQLLGDRR